MKTRIKICGITREQDACDAADLGADSVGFVLYPKSQRYVCIERAGQLARLLAPFVSPTLLFVNPKYEEVLLALDSVPNALLQFHGDESVQFCNQFKRPYLRAARIASIDETQNLEQQQLQMAQIRKDLLQFISAYTQPDSYLQAILLDAHVPHYGGAGKVFNWSLLPTNVAAPLVLSGGLTPVNVAQGLAALAPCVPKGKSLAVDVSSGVEISSAHKGLKDKHKIHAFIQAVHAFDAQYHD